MDHEEPNRAHSDMIVRFWGTRGSIPTPGDRTIRFGGNTTCVEVEYGGDGRIIIDAGSGIRPLGQKLIGEQRPPVDLELFFTHFHWDHIQGFPFFLPLYRPEMNINIWGAGNSGISIEQILKHQMQSVFPHQFGYTTRQYTVSRAGR